MKTIFTLIALITASFSSSAFADSIFVNYEVYSKGNDMKEQKGKMTLSQKTPLTLDVNGVIMELKLSESNQLNYTFSQNNSGAHTVLWETSKTFSDEVTVKADISDKNTKHPALEKAGIEKIYVKIKRQ